MEFDLHSNNVVLVEKQNILDWSLIGDSLPDISQFLSHVDHTLAPFPESIDTQYNHNQFDTAFSCDLMIKNIEMFSWNDISVTLPNDEILDPIPLSPITNISDVFGATSFENANQEASPPNCFVHEETFPWDMNSVILPNNDEKGLVDHSVIENNNKIMEEKEVTERKETGRSRLAHISHAEMKKYFSIPITRAAKELNVGLTILKKRCRELGIQRWPHRKIKSLRSLISNVQELGKDSEMESVRKELEMLENHKQLMEDNPEMQLTERTKKLRQACFKANYKKRRARATFYHRHHHR